MQIHRVSLDGMTAPLGHILWQGNYFQTDTLRTPVSVEDLGVLLGSRGLDGPCPWRQSDLGTASPFPHSDQGWDSKPGKSSQKRDGSFRTRARKQEERSSIERNLGNEVTLFSQQINVESPHFILLQACFRKVPIWALTKNHQKDTQQFQHGPHSQCILQIGRSTEQRWEEGQNRRSRKRQEELPPQMWKLNKWILQKNRVWNHGHEKLEEGEGRGDGEGWLVGTKIQLDSSAVVAEGDSS